MRTKEEEAALDAQVAEALACPCVADLKGSSCGAQFVTAFSCYVRSDAAEKGTDCAQLFLTMQACMSQHAPEFAAFGAELAASEAEHAANKHGAQAAAAR